MTNGEEDTSFYYEIGKALMRWADVEASLAKLVSICFDSDDDREILASTLFSIENFRSKTQFASELILQKFASNRHIKDWPRLVERMSRSAAKRNKIAHSKVLLYPDGAVGRRFALVPWSNVGLTVSHVPHRTMSKTKKAPSDALCVRDIYAIQDEFFLISMALLNLRARLCSEQEPFPGCDERPVDKPTTSELRNHIRIGLGLPLKPSRKKS